jgi:hypothetical protein
MDLISPDDKNYFSENVLELFSFFFLFFLRTGKKREGNTNAFKSNQEGRRIKVTG